MKLIRLQDVDRMGTYTVRVLDGSNREMYVGRDWDFPNLADTFGHYGLPHLREDTRFPCEERFSDGTIDCRCGYTVAQFIQDGIDFLDAHIGAKAEDPGYFLE